MTTVVKVRAFCREEFQAIPGFLYVGRAFLGWPNSPFANPWKVSEDYPAEANVRDFEREVLDASDAPGATSPFSGIRRRLPELRGRVLGCWCCDWDGTGEPSQPCHAVVLARLADGPLGDPRS